MGNEKLEHHKTTEKTTHTLKGAGNFCSIKKRENMEVKIVKMARHIHWIQF